MIQYEWEFRGLGVIRRKVQPGQLDEYYAVPSSEIPDDVQRAIAGHAFRSYAHSANEVNS